MIGSFPASPHPLSLAPTPSLLVFSVRANWIFLVVKMLININTNKIDNLNQALTLSWILILVIYSYK
jgi:hypothetical protein